MRGLACVALLAALAAPCGALAQDCGPEVAELEEAVLALGDERDALRERVKTLEAALAEAEADVDREVQRSRDILELQVGTRELWEAEMKRTRRVRFWSRFGCLVGAGVTAWDDAEAGVSLACGVRIFP